MAKLAWGAKVSPEFRARVYHMADRLQCDASALMACMAFETGRTFSPSIRNPSSGATGLIQFMPSTAVDLNTTVDALAAMSAVEQLDYVERYLNRYAGRFRTLSDIYMAILWPAAIGKPEDTPIFSEGSAAYRGNRGLDVDKDGNVTKAEASSYVSRALAEGMQPGNVYDDAYQAPPVIVTPAPSVTTPAPESSKDERMPFLRMLSPIAQILFQAFAPVIQQKVAAAVDRHSDKPGVGEAVANSLSNSLVQFAQQATGRTDPLEAVAVARQNPEVVAQAEQIAEQTVAERMKELAPILAISVEWDKQKWEAERAGRQAASAIAIAERAAGLADNGPVLIRNTEGQVWFVLVATMVGVVLAVYLTNDNMFMALIAFAGPVIGQLMKNKAQPNDYRWDGTKESSKQSDAMLRAMDKAGDAVVNETKGK